MRVLPNRFAPVLTLLGSSTRLDEVIEDQPIVWELESRLAKFSAPPLGEHLAEVVGLVGAKGTAKRPDGRELEVRLVGIFISARRYILFCPKCSDAASLGYAIVKQASDHNFTQV